MSRIYKNKIVIPDIGAILASLYFFIAINFSYWHENQSRYYFLICVVMILYFPFHYFFKNKLQYKKDSSINFYLLLVVYSIASFFLFKRYEGNLDILISFLKVAVIFLITFYYVDSKNKLVLVLIVLSVCAPVMYKFNQEYILLSRLSLQMGMQGGTRLAGTLANANQIAMISMASLWASSCLFFYIKNNVLRCVVLLPIIPAIYITLLSGSRKGLISIVLLAVLIIFFHVRHKVSKEMFKRYTFYMTAFCLIFYISISVANTPFGNRLIELIQLDTHSSSDTQRIGFMQASIKMWIESPVWGKGFNNFRNLSHQYGGTSGSYAHSTLWELLADLGLIGILLYFGMIYKLFKKMLAFLKNTIDEGDRILLKFGLFLIVIIVFYNMFAVMYFHKVFIPLIAAYSGYLYSLNKPALKKSTRLL